MKDIDNSYLLSLDPIEKIAFEKADPITEIQFKYNQLNERFVALKVLTETLKEHIETEKKLWNKELQETIKLEHELKEKHMYEEGCKKRLEMFKDCLTFCRARNHIDTVVKRKNYRSWLSEVDSQCEHELEKIKESLIALKPLKKIMSSWNEEKDCELLASKCSKNDKEKELSPIIEK